MLVIGGGIFVGRAIVAAARARGHAVTVFNRGQSGSAPAGVEAIRGDRNADLGALKGRVWEAVIDTCAYFPRQVRTLLSALGDSTSHYTLVSTVMVYRHLAAAGTTEAAELHPLPDPALETVTPPTYGPLKVACEHEAAGFRDRLIVRPGIIVGPSDPTGRFTYWVRRAGRGGELLAPGAPTDPLQLIDAQDLAEWLVARVEHRATGVFNAVGSPELTWGEMIRTVVEVAAAPTRVTWVGGEFLTARKADDWSQLPLFLPASNRELAGFFRLAGHAATRAGLSLRPLRETVAALQAWLPRPEAAQTKQPGLAPEREAALLADWAAGPR
jgi:2'-hydroxyisoflavone reductase